MPTLKDTAITDRLIPLHKRQFTKLDMSVDDWAMLGVYKGLLTSRLSIQDKEVLMKLVPFTKNLYETVALNLNIDFETVVFLNSLCSGNMNKGLVYIHSIAWYMHEEDMSSFSIEYISVMFSGGYPSDKDLQEATNDYNSANKVLLKTDLD